MGGIEDAVRSAFEGLFNDFKKKFMDNVVYTAINPIKDGVNIAINEVKNGFLGFFVNLGDFIMSVIVNPIMTFFVHGIGNTFVQFGNIMGVLARKIVELPHCALAYVIDCWFLIIRAYVPSSIYIICSYIYDYTIKFFLDIIGYNKWMDQCISFNVDDQIESTKSGWEDSVNAFVQSFGQWEHIGCIVDMSSSHPCQFNH